MDLIFWLSGKWLAVLAVMLSWTASFLISARSIHSALHFFMSTANAAVILVFIMCYENIENVVICQRTLSESVAVLLHIRARMKE